VNIIDKLCSIPESHANTGSTQQQDVSTDHDVNNTDNVSLNNVLYHDINNTDNVSLNNVSSVSNDLDNLNVSLYENSLQHDVFASNLHDCNLYSHKVVSIDSNEINHNPKSIIQYSDYYICFACKLQFKDCVCVANELHVDRS
jgi:hypothetical protein